MALQAIGLDLREHVCILLAAPSPLNRRRVPTLAPHPRTVHNSCQSRSRRTTAASDDSSSVFPKWKLKMRPSPPGKLRICAAGACDWPRLFLRGVKGSHEQGDDVYTDFPRASDIAHLSFDANPLFSRDCAALRNAFRSRSLAGTGPKFRGPLSCPHPVSLASTVNLQRPRLWRLSNPGIVSTARA